MYWTERDYLLNINKKYWLGELITLLIAFVQKIFVTSFYGGGVAHLRDSQFY